MDARSRAKATIVAKYFATWANVVIHANSRGVDKIAYIDLFAGPGRYKDGSASTPLLVLRTATNNPKIAQRLQAYFNDHDQNNSETLRSEIENLKDVSKLKFPPIVCCEEIDQETAKKFNDMNLVPSFTFIDPWGCKGFSLGLLQAVIKDWGCDCVFFFNFNRINAGISNSKVIKHMNALFGDEIANELRTKLTNQNKLRRQTLILEALVEAIRSEGGCYVLPFRFLKDNKQPSHFLIFVSKHFKGYEIMKDIMAKESSTEDQGVASFAYSPADESSPLLFSLQRPLDDLSDMLIETFSGREIPMQEIYMEHNVDTPFTKKNYKDILLQMEEQELITVTTSLDRKRRAGTMADHVIVKFPDQ